MDFDLDLLTAELDRRSGELLSMGIAWTRTRGAKDRDKCAGWVDVTSTTAFGQLIFWDSGEAELSAGSMAGPITDQHYDLESARDLEAAVSDLLRLLTDPISQD